MVELVTVPPPQWAWVVELWPVVDPVGMVPLAVAGFPAVLTSPRQLSQALFGPREKRFHCPVLPGKV